MHKQEKILNRVQFDHLLKILKSRFAKYKNRHQSVEWNVLQNKLEDYFSGEKLYKEKLWTLNEMERTGGEPDIVRYDDKSKEYFFYDCSVETPKDRRSMCYDRAGLESRKDFKPENNAMDYAAEMGVEILNEEEYLYLQSLGQFDTKTSSWLKTPDDIRKLGGAIFADYRYGKVFIYHNTASSYYAVRGFRGRIKI